MRSCLALGFDHRLGSERSQKARQRRPPDPETWLLRTDLVTADFGSQIRNYVMHPYKLVKDTRSGHETSDVAAILDGDLDSFLAQYLRHESAGQRIG